MGPSANSAPTGVARMTESGPRAQDAQERRAGFSGEN